MPRDGSNIYSQPFPDVVEDTTIESTVYNGFTNDIAADLNAARPIVAGGTGASSVTDARFNLAAEVSTQTVTNFDSHLWVPGSFRSTATPGQGAPVDGHAFGGWCYIGEALANPPTNQNVVVHAFDFDALANTALLYTRQKKAGVWSDWNITTTEDNQAGARQTIYAAPFDALAYNGMQINGSMEVSQENGATAVAVSNAGKFICDGWVVQSYGAAVSASQYPNGYIGLPKCLFVQVSTAKPSPTGTDLVMMNQTIEGYRIARLGFGAAGASSITIGFWFASTKNGTYSGAVRNGVLNNRSYVFSFAYAGGTLFEWKTVTIPGDVAGTWEYTNLAGLIFSVSVMAGPTLSGTPGSWVAGNIVAATGMTNGAATVGDWFAITGVVVLPGIEAPSAARSPLIMRPYDQELLTCQRYFYTQGGYTGYQYHGHGRATGATTATIVIVPKVVMRAAPTALSTVSSFALLNAAGGVLAVSSLTMDQAAADRTSVAVVCASGLVAGNATDLVANNTNLARIHLDARL